MIQCAGSRDQRHLPHCSRLCCMIALKHAIRLKSLFPEMKITICYLEMRTAGVGYENWFLDARRAGVEFLRGTPPEVQFDAAGRPVIEVEDVTAARKRVLRPDLVVLSTGMVPADGDRQARADARPWTATRTASSRSSTARTAPRRRAAKASSSAAPPPAPRPSSRSTPKPRRWPARSTTSSRRPGAAARAASRVDASQCVGCDTCSTMCPFNAITLVDRPEGRRGRTRSRMTASLPSSTPRAAAPAASAPPTAPRSRSRTTSATTPCSAASRP